MTVPSLILRLEPLPENAAGGSPPSTALRAVVDLDDSEPTTSPLARWSAASAAAHDPCLVLDRDGAIVSISAAAADLLGCSDAGVIGRQLLDVIDVVDFETGSPNPDYAARITPLAVLDGQGLSRSVLRVRHPDDALVTVDTASASVHDAAGSVVGSVSFLASVGSA